MEKEETRENYKPPDSSCSSVKQGETGSNTDFKKYIMWENISNNCWLDASLALIAHNKVMKKYSEHNKKSNISKIILAYGNAITILNTSEDDVKAKLELKEIQKSVYQYLQPFLKNKNGEPESAFCSLLNLLKEDTDLKSYFDVEWISMKESTNCGRNSQSTKRKPIITLSKIDSFDPANPSIIYNCVCNKSQQKIKLVYVTLPPCLIFHFENGAGKECPPLSFITREREYHLTAIMTLSKAVMMYKPEESVSHFITWIRNPDTNKWLDCNDLNNAPVSFSPDFPRDIKFNDSYMYVYESFDNLGIITDNKINIVKIKVSEENIPCIDLSGESDTESGSSQNSVVKSSSQNSLAKSSSQNSVVKSSSQNSVVKPSSQNSEMKSSSQNSEVKSSSQNSVVKSNKNVQITETLKMDLKSSNNNKTLSESFEDKSVKTLVSKEENIPLHMGIQNLNDVSNNAVNLNSNKIIKSTEADTVKVPRENIKPNNDLSILNTPPSVNMTLNSGDNTKNMDENICKSDCTDLVIEKVNDNSPSISTIKETLKERSHSITEDRPEICKVKCKTSNKNSSKVCSSEMDKIPELPKSLLAFNSNAEQEIQSEQFLADAAACSFEPSYIRVSLRKRKCSSHPFFQKRDTGTPDSCKISGIDMDNPSPLKSLKRKIVEYSDDSSSEDSHPVLNKTQKKKKRSKKISTVKRNDDITTEECVKLKGQAIAAEIKLKIIPQGKSNRNKETVKDQGKVAKIGPKRKHRVKSSPSQEAMLEDNSSLNVEEIQSIQRNSNVHRGHSHLQAASTADNSNSESSNVKILENYEHLYSLHKPDCYCDDSSDLEEMIDTNVDFAFGYFWKLSQEYKKFSAV